MSWISPRVARVTIDGAVDDIEGYFELQVVY